MHRRVVRMSMETTTLDHTHRDIGLNTMIHYWKHRGLLLHRDFDFQIALHIIHSSFSINKHTIPGRFGRLDNAVAILVAYGMLTGRTRIGISP